MIFINLMILLLRIKKIFFLGDGGTSRHAASTRHRARMSSLKDGRGSTLCRLGTEPRQIFYLNKTNRKYYKMEKKVRNGKILYFTNLFINPPIPNTKYQNIRILFYN